MSTTISLLCSPVLAAAFLFSSALWMGTLFSASWLTGRARLMADGPEIGRLALSLVRRWAVPSLLTSVATGIGWIATAPPDRVQEDWVRAIAGAVFVLFLLHVTFLERAKRVVEGSVRAARGEGARRLALLVSFGVIAALASLRGSLLP